MGTERRSSSWPLIMACALATVGCSALSKGRADLDVGMKERGIASWYGEDFHGWPTANGEIYDMYAMTGAHRTLPLGTVVRVTNVVNGTQVQIRINDRGPYKKGRILDLSYQAAEELNMVSQGVSAVYLEVIGHHDPDSSAYSRMIAFPERGGERASPAAWPVSDPSSEPVGSVGSRGDRQLHRLRGDVIFGRRARHADDIVAVGRPLDAVVVLALV